MDSDSLVHLAVHLVDVWNMIEAFRDNGLNTLDHNAEINVSRLETILSSIYYQLNKRLPTTHQINVEQSIGLLLNFMVATYDRYGTGGPRRVGIKLKQQRSGQKSIFIYLTTYIWIP